MEKKEMSKVLLFNDDCVNVLKNLQSESVDLCLTDLPYGILTVKKEADYQNENRNFCDWDFEINYDEVLPQLKRVMKKDGNILLFAKSPFTFNLYEQMIKHGFKHRYNWIWKKQQCANFASMKYRPGNNYEEVMVFTPTPKRGKYFAHAEYNGETKTKCKFYNYETRTPIPTEEVFDKYLIPYILGNVFTENINILTANLGHESSSSNASGTVGIKLKEILNEDVNVSIRDSGRDNTCVSGIKLQEILNDDIRIPNMGTAGNKMFSANSTASMAGIKLQEILNEDIRLQTIGSDNWLAISPQGARGETKLVDLFKDIGVCTSTHRGEIASDNVTVPVIQLNQILNKDIKILTDNRGTKGVCSNAGFAGKSLKDIFNEDIGICTHIHGGETHSANMTIPKIKLAQIFKEDIKTSTTNKSNVGINTNKSFTDISLKDIMFLSSNNGNKVYNENMSLEGNSIDLIFKEKYQGQFEIDLENKILYRTVKSYKNFPTSIIDIKYKNDAGKKYKKHPTTKPVEVLEFLIQHYTEEGDTVLDFTMGSGSTGVASKKKKRNFIGCQIGKMWYEVAQARIKDIEE